MADVFDYSTDELKEKDALQTALEITQQPNIWLEMVDDLSRKQNEIIQFMERVFALPQLRVVFTGAGSSAFIGESMKYLLAREGIVRAENIHSTDIVAAPDAFLYDTPTLLVSFARSGDSPESLGAVQYANQCVHELYNLLIVCSGDNQLVSYVRNLDNTLIIVMPEKSCDLGFAMTSSVSCMALAAWCVFGYKNINNRISYVRQLAHDMHKEMPIFSKIGKEIAARPYSRIVYLGSGALYGLAQEASVKSLELTNGQVNATYNTPTGFRHGPKAVINDETLVVLFISPVPHTMKYDLDLARELVVEKEKNLVAFVIPDIYAGKAPKPDYTVIYSLLGDQTYHELCSYIKSLVFAQVLSFEKSIERGIRTDHPNTAGYVNRIVRGVTIYALSE